jgi:hypothetical protein
MDGNTNFLKTVTFNKSDITMLLHGSIRLVSWREAGGWTLTAATLETRLADRSSIARLAGLT